MATYDGWTELREWRVWSAEDVWSYSTVLKHRNGWYRVETSGEDAVFRTRSETRAFDHAAAKAAEQEPIARLECPCKAWGDDTCGDPEANPYGDAHSVRTHVVDMIENRELQEYEL